MKYLMAGILALLCGFFLADFLFRQQGSEVKNPGIIPFDHSLHGDSIGLDCSHCHTGVIYQAHAYMPSKADCMDCHRLPLTENPGIERLDSLWRMLKSFLGCIRRFCRNMWCFIMDCIPQPRFCVRIVTVLQKKSNRISMAESALPCKCVWIAIVARLLRTGTSKGRLCIAGHVIARLVGYG